MHTTGLLPTHVPEPLHVSVCVHWFPSLQLVPLLMLAVPQPPASVHVTVRQAPGLPHTAPQQIPQLAVLQLAPVAVLMQLLPAHSVPLLHTWPFAFLYVTARDGPEACSLAAITITVWATSSVASLSTQPRLGAVPEYQAWTSVVRFAPESPKAPAASTDVLAESVPEGVCAAKFEDADVPVPGEPQGPKVVPAAHAATSVARSQVPCSSTSPPVARRTSSVRAPAAVVAHAAKAFFSRATVSVSVAPVTRAPAGSLDRSNFTAARRFAPTVPIWFPTHRASSRPLLLLAMSW